jgi:hypothetical protein
MKAKHLTTLLPLHLLCEYVTLVGKEPGSVEVAETTALVASERSLYNRLGAALNKSTSHVSYDHFHTVGCTTGRTPQNCDAIQLQ